MNKDNMIKEVAERATDILNADCEETKYKITKKEVEAILSGYAACVFENLAANKTEKVVLPGIGSFTAKHVDERTGTSKLRGVETKWTSPAHDELVFTIKKSVRTLD